MEEGAGAARSRFGPRRVVVGLASVALVAALGAVVVAVAPRSGAALPDGERLRLLQQAGLPPDFPVHPFARRMAQPAQGGFSYALSEPVADVVSWQRQSLTTSGYEVFNADVEGQDEDLPHWLYFRSRAGGSGAIIVRPNGRGFTRGTEVKVLSRADARLMPHRGAATVPAGTGSR